MALAAPADILRRGGVGGVDRLHRSGSLRISSRIPRGLTLGGTPIAPAALRRGSRRQNFRCAGARGSSDGDEDNKYSTRAPVVKGTENSRSESHGAEEVPLPGNGGGLGDFGLLQTRRFWLGTSVAVLAALGGNLVGVTSSLFNLNPAGSRSVRADLLFPVKGFKRCLESSQGFEFIYPMSWLGDQRLLYRAAARVERERSLYPSPTIPSARITSRDPVVAFGPPGTEGELNVSVVVAPVLPNFTLQQIGGPQEAGEFLLKQFIAPEGSGKVAVLLNAQQRIVEDQVYYMLEYSVKGSTFFRHNLAVYATSKGRLISLNAQSSESTWKKVEGDFIEMGNSFKLLL